MQARPRPRVTIDLRGLDVRLSSFVNRRSTTAAAAIRRAVIEMLEREDPVLRSPGGAGRTARQGSTVKVTLRLPSSHAGVLAARSRGACLSLGDYVCGLLDGSTPVEVPTDAAVLLDTLDRSTDVLSSLGADLGAMLRRGSGSATPGVEDAGSTTALRKEVRQHLLLLAVLVRDLEPLRQSIRSAAHRSVQAAGAP